jgi:hypothetical protein
LLVSRAGSRHYQPRDDRMLNRGTVKIVSGVDQVQTDNAVPYHRAADTVDE